MGYSKWRKILTILMIISICFTLFGKISKVFATDVNVTPTSIYIYGKYYDFYLDNIVSNYNYYFLFNYNDYINNSISNKGVQELLLFCSNDEINFRTEIDNNGNITGYVFSESANNTHSVFAITDRVTQRYNYDVIASSFSSVGFDNTLNSGGYTNIAGSGSYPTSYPYAYQGINIHFQWNENTYYFSRYSAIASSNSDPEYNFLYSNYDIIDDRTNEVFYLSSTRKPPELATPISDLENLTFEGLSVNSWGYSNIDFYLLIYDRTLIKNDYDYVLNPAREILLNKDSEFYQPYLTSDPDTNRIYWIPISEIGLQFAKNGLYEIRFGVRNYDTSGGTGGGGFRGEELEATGNLFITTDVTQSQLINKLNETSYNSLWALTDYIPVYDSVTYSGLSAIGTTPYSAFYDINKNFIYSFKQQLGENTVDVPSNAYFVRFSLRKSDIDNFNVTSYVRPTPINYDELYNGGNGAFGGYVPKYEYEFIGENYAWSLDENVSQVTIDDINNQIKLTDEQRRHYEQMSLLEQFLNGDITSNDGLMVSSGLFRENNQDITANGFNGIFARLYNAINSTPQSVSLTIPFTNTPMVIDPQVTYNGLGQNNAILTFYQISIFAAVSLFILKDIAKIIQDIKTGDIATSSDTNIKANML